TDAAILPGKFLDPVSLRAQCEDRAGLRLAPPRIARAGLAADFPVTGFEVRTLEDIAHAFPEFSLERSHRHMAAIRRAIDRVARLAPGQEILAARMGLSG